jgi:beta-lactamase regulating signal transducer with metallopeptidase domain
MIASWMVFSIVTGCAFTMAAVAADRLASIGRQARRFVWFTAMVVTACWPAIILARTALFPARDSSAAALLPVSGAHRLSTIIVSAPMWDVSPYWSALIVLVWGVLTTWLAARFVFAIRYVRRSQATWRSLEIDGMTVRIARDAGPAVIGLWAMDVVLPEWVLAMSQPELDLILRHETEHRKARDPSLLLIATLLTALFPWNPALWFQARRLRIAIEIDCDNRVLQSHPRWRDYALLLLTIAQRQTSKRRQLAPALSEPISNLERRITAMHTKPTFSPFRSVFLGVATVAAFALACAVEKPASPDHTSQVQASVGRKTAVGSTQVIEPNENNTYFEFQVNRLARPRETPHLEYPAAMRGSGIGGEVVAQFVVRNTGQVDMDTFKVEKSTGPEFTAVVKGALGALRFDPAVIRGKRVNQLVEWAFQFAPPGA